MIPPRCGARNAGSAMRLTGRRLCENAGLPDCGIRKAGDGRGSKAAVNRMTKEWTNDRKLFIIEGQVSQKKMPVLKFVQSRGRICLRRENSA